MGKSSPNHGERHYELCNSFHKFELLTYVYAINYTRSFSQIRSCVPVAGCQNWWTDTFFKIEGMSL